MNESTWSIEQMQCIEFELFQSMVCNDLGIGMVI